MKTILETERLLLENSSSMTLKASSGWSAIPYVVPLHGPCGEDLEEGRKGLEGQPLQDYRKHGYGRWAAVYKPTGKVIGFTGLKYLDDVKEVDLGYRFFKEFWGKGLATEASRAIVAYGFDVLRLPRIVAFADIDNKASIRMLEKVGLCFENFTAYWSREVARYGLDREPV